MGYMNIDIGKVEGRIEDKLRKQSINEGKCISKIQMEMYSKLQKNVQQNIEIYW